VALLGPNGSGKTTFLKTLLGEVQPLAGYARLGASLKLGYFAQVHADLDPEKSVLDTILDVKNLPLAEARSFLARFLFGGDDVFKPIAVLSGGERSRVALAKLVLQRANFLLLDEPTNHLDIASQEVLQAVLDEFGGTVLLVTHDRYLVDRLATQLWIIDGNRRILKVFQGTWDEYVAVRDQEKEAAEARPVREKWSADQRQQLEAEIQRLEAELEALQGEIAAASEAHQSTRLHELGTLYGEIERQLQQQLDLWAELAGQTA